MPMNPFAIGLGTRKYQPDNQPVKVCNEMILPGCDCCRIGPCKLCLKWTVGVTEKNGKATGDGEQWSGTAGPISFRAYWDETYCTINVELNGELVWVRSLCEGYSGSEITCRNWDGSVEYKLYGGEPGIFEWKVTEYLELARRDGQPDTDSCLIDIMVVFDSQTANEPAVQDIQGGAMQPLVDLLESQSGSYQLGLISFRNSEETVVTDLALGLNNGAAFLAAVDNITVSENTVIPPGNTRPLGTAMALAADQGWRSSAQKICILVNQGAFSGFSVSPYSIASAMRFSGITTNAITTGYWTDPGPTHAYNLDSQEVNVNISSAGGGSHSKVISDGTLDYNGGIVTLPDAIKGFADDLCGSGERHCFARSFCGDCDCSCPEICVTVRGGGVVCTGVVPFTGSRCKDGTVSVVSWEGDIECLPGDDTVHVTVGLSSDDYNDTCVLSGSVTGTIGGVAISIDLTPQVVSNCKFLGGAWSKDINDEPYTVVVSCLECDECGGIITECCPDVLLSETLFVDFIQIAKGVDIILPPPSPPSLGDDCSCAAITVPVYGGALIGLGNDEGFWTSGIIGWPCPSWGPTAPTDWRVELACSAGVFTLSLYWLNNCISSTIGGAQLFCNPVADSSMTATDLECDPLEITFRGDTPTSLFPAGICEGLIQPAHMMAVVTE